MMNELELVYWYCTCKLVKIYAPEEEVFFLNRLMMSALFAKKRACNNEDGEIFECFLIHNYQ